MNATTPTVPRFALALVHPHDPEMVELAIETLEHDIWNMETHLQYLKEGLNELEDSNQIEIVQCMIRQFEAKLKDANNELYCWTDIPAPCHRPCTPDFHLRKRFRARMEEGWVLCHDPCYSHYPFEWHFSSPGRNDWESFVKRLFPEPAVDDV